jgi:hypothetical protein
MNAQNTAQRRLPKLKRLFPLFRYRNNPLRTQGFQNLPGNAHVSRQACNPQAESAYGFVWSGT